MTAIHTYGLASLQDSPRQKSHGHGSRPATAHGLICVTCGTYFETKSNTAICCSKECSKEHRLERARKYQEHRYTTQRPQTPCPICERSICTFQDGRLYPHGSGKVQCEGSGMMVK